MPIVYLKPDVLVATCCDHCGTLRKETFARLYSDEKLMCACCGQEHTADRSQFRQAVEETERMVARMSAWTDKLFSWRQ